MHDKVTENRLVAPEFEVRNGLRQGCVIAPTLFNLYFAMVMEQWRAKSKEFGVDVMYKCWLVEAIEGELKAMKLLLANNVTAANVNRQTIERAAMELEKVIKAWGIDIEYIYKEN